MNRQLTKSPAARSIRCAIYTRKSTSDGLEQEFNSLNAQREACEAYITSQHHEGWTCLTTLYDDGGYTGANTDRPGLKQILADVDAGKIDCVVVQRVDRISRSLLDFIRIMEIFERHNVAFVSTTQSFSTASPMGRLILHILMSFAEFERAMISERTRDKIAAARRKGKWSGGTPILGYSVVETKLVIDQAEAQRVREIFALYLKLKSLLAVVRELTSRGWRTKRWTTKKGNNLGGRPFNKCSLHQLLTNPAYTGKVRYKDEIHPGEHMPIVDPEVFARAQTLLQRNARNGGRDVRNKHGALLRGLLHCAACNCGMCHSFTSKGSRAYRYYTCVSAQKKGWDSCPSPSIPAGEIEKFVVNEIKGIGTNAELIQQTLAQARQQSAHQIERYQDERTQLRNQLRADHTELASLAATVRPTDPRLADAHDRIRESEQRMSELESVLVSLEANLVNEVEVTAALADFHSVWDCLSPREQSRVIELLVERVVYDGVAGTVSITFQPTGMQAFARELAQRPEEAA